jgi:hypothetical protein
MVDVSRNMRITAPRTYREINSRDNVNMGWPIVGELEMQDITY